MSAAGRLSAALVAAVMLSAVSLTPITQDRAFLATTLLLVTTSALVGAVARRLGAGEIVVRIAQAAAGLAVTYAGMTVLGLAGTNPAGDTIEALGETAEFVRTGLAPMPAHAGVLVASSVILWLLYLVVETLAIGLDRPAWTFPPLLVPYLIPAIAVYEEAGFGLFALCAAGYVLVLLADTVNRFSADVGRVSPGIRPSLTAGAALAGVLALLASLSVAMLVPERLPTGFGQNDGPGPVQMGDPSLDLIRNINATSDRVVITYRTTRPEGMSLRLAALSTFDDTGFGLTQTELLGMPLPDPPGRRLPAGERHVTEVQIGDFVSEWLPVPWAPVRTDAQGDWRYDPSTLALISLGQNRRIATRNLDYRVESQDVVATRADLEGATAGRPNDDGNTLALPPGRNTEIDELAFELTASSSTDGQRALALMDFLRSDAFTYSTVGVPGSSLGTLHDFLLVSRTGYCEQFAGGLAAMARVVGIPSRVVIGFLPGRPVEDHWEVSVRNMHAWTELYFEDHGWVAVDPTPPAAVAPSGAPSPTTAAPSAPEATPSPTSSTEEVTDTDAAEGSTTESAGRIGWGALILLGLAATAGPWSVRTLRRHRRLSSRGDMTQRVEGAWEEVRDAVWDAGGTWPTGSPRQIGEAIAAGLPSPEAEQFRTLAVLVEQVRYAAHVDEVGALGPLVASINSALRDRRGMRQHPWRRLWPRSVWRRPTPRR